MIEARALTRTFPGRAEPALQDVSFSIARGEIVALAGRNGAGKSTLLDVLSTLLLPSAGEARVAGFDVRAEAAAVRRHAGYAAAGPRGFYARLTGRRNLEFFAALHPHVRDARSRVDELVALLDLSPFVGDEVRRCSDGMLQKLVLARALLGRPPVLLLDEPMRALDAVAQQHVAGVLTSLTRSGAIGAVLYSTHDLDAPALPHGRAIVLSRGRVIFDGVPARGQLTALLGAEPRA